MTKQREMKKSFLLLPLIGAFVYVTMSSDSNGPGGNRTGSRGGTIGCGGGGCHGSSANTGITVAFELDSAGTPVTRYKPGMTYTLKMTGTNTTSSSLPKFGMQMSMVSGSGSSSVNQGASFASLPSGVSSHTSSTITILEHNQRLSPTSGTGGTSTTYVVSASWTAPAAGTGTVTAWGVVNAVNNSPANADAGDLWNGGSASFTELPSNVGVNNVAAATITVYPNPVSNVFTVSGVNGTVNVFDVNGKIISTVSVNNTAAIDASAWANGVYFLSISNDGQVISKTIVKQ